MRTGLLWRWLQVRDAGARRPTSLAALRWRWLQVRETLRVIAHAWRGTVAMYRDPGYLRAMQEIQGYRSVAQYRALQLGLGEAWAVKRMNDLIGAYVVIRGQRGLDHETALREAGSLWKAMVEAIQP